MSADNCVDCYRREVLEQLTQLCEVELKDVVLAVPESPTWECLRAKIRMLTEHLKLGTPEQPTNLKEYLIKPRHSPLD